MEAKKTQKIYNLIIVDASGSMRSIYNQALAGMNETISTIKQAQRDMPEQLQYLTLISFADGGRPLEVMNKLTPISMVAEKTSQDYTLRGCTALHDAIGDSITELRKVVKDNDKALVTIITDGGENDSKRWRGQEVKELIAELKSQGWVFTFIGANQDVEFEARKVGITNTLKFEATIEGTVEMFRKEGRSRRNWNERVYRGEEGIEEGYFNEESFADPHEIDNHRVTPQRIDRLAPGEIFVFGSNREGRHNGGAARAALKKFGARYGMGMGLHGQSYAIPTTGHTSLMIQAISDFVDFARRNPQLRFLVTAIGCGNAGYSPEEIAPMFREAINVANIALPIEFWQVLKRI